MRGAGSGGFCFSQERGRFDAHSLSSALCFSSLNGRMAVQEGDTDPCGTEGISALRPSRKQQHQVCRRASERPPQRHAPNAYCTTVRLLPALCVGHGAAARGHLVTEATGSFADDRGYLRPKKMLRHFGLTGSGKLHRGAALTCATGTPGAVVCKQIDHFSSSVQSRLVRRATLVPSVSTIIGGH